MGQDKTLKCKDCGEEFLFTVGEQEFFQEKGFENEPVRCPDCRRARKQRNQGSQSNQGGYSSSGSGRRF